MSKGWDNIMIKKLRALTGKGLSTAEIGRKLGLSKNAVVGKLNRLGWNSKANSTAATSSTEPKRATKKTTTTKKKIEVVAKTDTKKTTATKKTITGAVVSKKAEVKSKSTTVPSAAKKTVANKKDDVKSNAGTKKTSNKGLNKTLAMHQRIIQHSLEMANLKSNQCRWPIGDPDSEHFHFCGETVFAGKPYCYEHCKQAYQFTPPKKK